jgi:hypothetical protein
MRLLKCFPDRAFLRVGRDGALRRPDAPAGRPYQISSKSRRKTEAAALIIVLAFMALLTGLALAYFSHTATDRQLAHASFHDASADLLARNALDIIVSSLKREITVAGVNVTQANIQPQRSGDDASIPSLIRRSVRNDTIPPPGVPSFASIVSSGPVDPANPKRGEITRARWNSHYLVPTAASFTPPDWVLVTLQGPNPAPLPSDVVGRYAFAVYDEGGLLDMNLAGFPAWAGSSASNPEPTPTPWQVNVGRKGTVAFADLGGLPAAPTSSQMNKIVGWRNYGTTKQTATTFRRFSFQLDPSTQQDAWGSYLLDFGDAPYTDPSIDSFTSVPSDFPSYSRTDQAFMTRKELLRLQGSIGFSQDLLQYMGTFSRERNRPAPDWRSLRLPDRFPMNAVGLVKPAPPDSVTTRGRGNGDGNGVGWRGRGRYRGSIPDILGMFGLAWVNGTGTDKSQLAYWGRWQYVGEQQPSEPNNNPLAYIPPLRARPEFVKILNYALNVANAGWDAFSNDTNLGRVARTLSIAASLIDQYDDSGDTNERDPTTGSHTTIIEYGGGFVLGWENENNPSSPGYQADKDPYAWIIDPNTGSTKPRPATVPIVLNHPFSNVGEFGYGLDTANGFQPLNFVTETSNDKAVLDFFMYNPVLHTYPRAGIFNLNTRNVPVIAAALKAALKNDTIAPPSSSGVISASEATTAAQRIVDETKLRPVLNRADVARLVRVGANTAWTKEQKEAIARALAEMGQARTWNLMIDVIAQTGKCAPGETDFAKFIVEGEKRYWLHIALARDLNTDRTVDVFGAQLEEVSE